MRLIVVGAGDVGGEVAARWVADGGKAVGITRTDARHAELAARGVTPTTDDPTGILQPDDAVLLSISGSSGQRAAAELLQGLSCARAVLTSSTGVYGRRSGALGPDTPPGASERAQAAAAAEAAFRTFAPHGHVLRLGGLYRRGRGPQESLRRRGHAPGGPAERPLPLVHRDDAATAVLGALRGRTRAPVANVVMHPVPTRLAWYTLACDLLELPAPTFDEGGVQRTFDTRAFDRELVPEPRWPDWRQGLRHALG